MHGRLFTLFDTPFPSYFVLIVIGFVFAATMGALWARRVGQNPDVIVDLGLLALLSGFAGARVLHIFADGHLLDYVHMCTDPSLVDWHITEAECKGPSYQGAWDVAKGVCHPTEVDCFAWAQFWSGGFTFFGGLIAATIASWWLFRRDRFPFWKAIDMGGMMVPIGLGFGRLGCLMAGCCFGEVSLGEVPWALSFPGASPASDWQAKEGLLAHHLLPSLPVHPTQIYESFAAFAIAAFGILYLHGRKRYDGQVFAFFLVSYGVARFGIEFLRSDERGGFFALSTSQWIGVFAFGAGLLLHWSRSRFARSLPKLPAAAALTAVLCAALFGCGPKEKVERFPPVDDRCNSDLCMGGGAVRNSGGGGVVTTSKPAADDSQDAQDDAGALEALAGDVKVAINPELSMPVDLEDAVLEVSASSPNGGVKLTDYNGDAPFQLGVSAFPALLIARQTSGDADLLTTLQWVEQASSELELLILQRQVLQDVADNLGSGPATIDTKAGHVMLDFVDQTGLPVPDVTLTSIGVNGAVVTYDLGGTYTDATASTAERGSILLLNVPAGALPGNTVRFEYESPVEQGSVETLVAKDAITLRRVSL